MTMLQNGEGEWVQSFEYTPDLYDDGQNLECSIRDGMTGEQVEDHVKLTMIMFKPAKGNNLH